MWNMLNFSRSGGKLSKMTKKRNIIQRTDVFLLFIMSAYRLGCPAENNLSDFFARSGMAEEETAFLKKANPVFIIWQRIQHPGSR